MNERELLARKFINVRMNDAQISTSERPIIGTDALSTCRGVLLYSEEKNVAIVAHVSCEEYMVMDTIDKIFKIITDNKLYRVKFKYKIFPGYYPDDHYGITSKLEEYFKDFIPFKDEELLGVVIVRDDAGESCCFAFDVDSGRFVTDKVYFDSDYIAVNGKGKGR